MTIKNAAQSFLDAGLNILPVKKTKSPLVSEWKKYETEYYPDDLPGFDSAWGIGVICGEVSEGLECIDFDAKVSPEHIRSVFNAFAKDPGVKSIISRHKVYIQKTQSGGYHFVYKYEHYEKREGAKKLAMTEDGKQAIIETRGEGGYFVAAPSPGYDIKLNSLTSLGIMSIDERDYLIDLAKSFCMSKKIKDESNNDEIVHFEKTDPISFFNWSKSDYAKNLLRDAGWEMVTRTEKAEQWRRPGKKEGISATWGYKYNSFYVFSTSAAPFENECYYTPFQILLKLKFKSNYRAAISWILQKYFDQSIPYIRVGVDYFKLIEKVDRYGISGVDLKAWKKDEIKQDHGRDYIEDIPKYDSFCMKPSNINFEPVIGNCYNLYSKFRHIPAPGSTYWTDILMEQIFGDQIELGWRYMKLLYKHPDRHAPILVLVSKDRSTGKSTFLNFLNMIFSDNFTVLTPEVFKSDFNSMYAYANIIAIEETKIERDSIVQKLKAVSTQKTIAVNQKYVQPFIIPFYGKFILTSNDEEKFAKIEQEEIRFFVRNLKEPKVVNHNIETELKKEIPALLYKLNHIIPDVDFSLSRNGFLPEELDNEGLKRVKQESKSWLYSELYEYIRDYFMENEHVESFDATLIDIKQKWFDKNNKVEVKYLKSVINNEFNIQPQKLKRYNCIIGNMIATKPGTPYEFKRSDFCQDFLSDDVNSVNYQFTPEPMPF
jgi:hypothetical protein